MSCYTFDPFLLDLAGGRLLSVVNPEPAQR